MATHRYLLAISLLAGACEGPAELQLVSPQGMLQIGTEVHLAIENRTNRPLGHNLCTVGLEAESPEGWSAITNPFGDGPCNESTVVILPGTTAAIAPKTIVNAPQGMVRFHCSVDADARSVAAGQRELYTAAIPLGLSN